MVRKNGVNIMLFAIIILQVLIISCTQEKASPGPEILIKTDSAFSDLSLREGMFRAFLGYIAEDGVILRDNSFPEKGREALQKRFEGKSDTTFILTWKPLFGNISAGGDLGYTYGIYTNKDKASGEVTKGTYVTVWKIQPGGSWKFVLDGGTQGLPDQDTLPAGTGQ
ncbi:MAG: hypothetical protein MUD02_00490 [Bacteroidales bacterium]|jgi:ketosteroid isomerase-like protein|nr:hypothetical protein [Bacteroidales bacterium]